MIKLKSERKFDMAQRVVEIGRNVCFGGGGSPDTSGQNEAARMNAQIAKEMWGEYQNTYLPRERQYASEAFNYDTPERREKMAGQAQADVEQAVSNQNASLARNLESSGVNPGSAAFQSQLAKNNIQAAAMEAGAANAARNRMEDVGWARKQDAISLGKGLPGTASSAMANAGNGYAQIASQQASQNQADSANTASAVGGAFAAANMFKKDGGPITRNTCKPKKPTAQRLAGGGMVMNPAMQQVMAGNAASAGVAVPAGKPGATPLGVGMSGVQAYKFGQAMDSVAAKLAAQYGTGTGTGAGTAGGIANGTATTGATTTGATTTGATTTGATTAGTTTAGATTTAAGGSLGAGEGALGMGAATTTGTTAGTAVGAAASGSAPLAALGPVGMIAGAALLASQYLHDGGKVATRRAALKDITDGGKISGPGTETSDSVPLMGSDGEFMVNAEAVKMPGVRKKLERINAAGLAKRYGIKGVRA